MDDWEVDWKQIGGSDWYELADPEDNAGTLYRPETRAQESDDWGWGDFFNDAYGIAKGYYDVKNEQELANIRMERERLSYNQQVPKYNLGLSTNNNTLLVVGAVGVALVFVVLLVKR